MNPEVESICHRLAYILEVDDVYCRGNQGGRTAFSSRDAVRVKIAMRYVCLSDPRRLKIISK